MAFPMCLTDALIKDSLEHNIKIADEYWKPQKDWKFLEYLSNQMEILEVLDDPSFEDKIKGRLNYDYDYEKRGKL